MALKDPFAQDCLEKLQELGPVTAKAMFGGYGFYWDGVFFAVVAEPERLHFKTDEQSVGEFESAGAEQWIIDGGPTMGPGAMKYWSPPGEFLENREELRRWVELAVEAGRRSAKKSRKS